MRGKSSWESLSQKRKKEKKVVYSSHDTSDLSQTIFEMV